MPQKVAKKGKEKEIGKVTHFFDQISVAVIELKTGLKVGDKIRIVGATTNFEQKVDSIQIEHKAVAKAGKGDAIGTKMIDKVRPNDKVYVLE